VFVPASDASYIVSWSASGARHCLNVPANVTLMGDGMFRSTIEADSGETLGAGTVFMVIEIGSPTTAASGVTIKDLGVIGNFAVINPASKYIQGIAAQHDSTLTAHSDDVTIERVRVKDVNVGIYNLKDGTESSGRTASRFRRWSVRHCQVEDSGNKAIELNESEDSEIVGNTTIDCQDGLQVLCHTVRSRVADNHVQYKDGGINVTHGCSDIEVTGNVLTALAGTPVGFQAGIVIRQEAYAAAGPTSARVYIHHNLIRDHVSTDQCGIRFASYTSNTGVGVFDDYTIANNVFDVGGDSYLYDDEFPAKTSATGLRIFDNIFRDNALTSASWSSVDTRVERNRFETNHTANGGTWHYRGNDFDGTFTVSGSGITLDDGYIGNVLVSGTPSSGQHIVATSATAAAWATDSGGSTHWEPVQFDDGSAEWPFVYFNGELVMTEVPN
jgi:hypothetical protein